MGLSECIWYNVFTNWTKNTWNAWNGRANLELWPWFFVLCLKLHLVGVPNKSKKCTYSIWREELSYWATFLGHHEAIQPGVFPLRALGTKTRQKLNPRLGKSMRKIKHFQTIKCNYKNLSVEIKINCNFNQSLWEKGQIVGTLWCRAVCFLRFPTDRTPCIVRDHPRPLL